MRLRWILLSGERGNQSFSRCTIHFEGTLKTYIRDTYGLSLHSQCAKHALPLLVAVLKTTLKFYEHLRIIAYYSSLSWYKYIKKKIGEQAEKTGTDI